MVMESKIVAKVEATITRGRPKDAIAGYLFSLEKHGEAVPLPVNEEVVEVPA